MASILRLDELQSLSGVSALTVGTDGKLTLPNGFNRLTLPSWTTSTRPSSPVIGLVGYNTEKQVTEIYTGSTTTWVNIGTSASPTLAVSVGVTPVLHYQSSDLNTTNDGTVINASNFWKNNGSYGTSYNLVNDTSGHYSSNVTVTTQSGKKAANFSGFCALAFSSAAYFNIYTANSYPVWTVAYVYGGGAASSSTNVYSPSFMGHAQGPSTNIPDRVGGGLFGWGYPSWGAGSTCQHWYENDGGVLAGDPGGDNTAPNQYVNVVNTSASQNSSKSWKGKTSGPFYNSTHSGISIGSGPTYGYNIPISGMGNTRRADSSAWTCTGYLYDAVLFNAALTDTQIQALRDYYAITYPIGNVAA